MSICSALARISEFNKSDSDSLVGTIPICMAPCCHSICEWDECFYQDFFTSLGFSPADYAILAAASQWASIQDGSSALTQRDEYPASDNCELVLTGDILKRLASISPSAIGVEYSPPGTLFCDTVEEEQRMLCLESEDFEAMVSRRMKRKIGIACKEIIDIGRSVGLLVSGYYEIRLVRYTRSSKENLLICAK